MTSTDIDVGLLYTLFLLERELWYTTWHCQIIQMFFEMFFAEATEEWRALKAKLSLKKSSDLQDSKARGKEVKSI